MGCSIATFNTKTLGTSGLAANTTKQITNTE